MGDVMVTARCCLRRGGGGVGEGNRGGGSGGSRSVVDRGGSGGGGVAEMLAMEKFQALFGRENTLLPLQPLPPEDDKYLY